MLMIKNPFDFFHVKYNYKTSCSNQMSIKEQKKNQIKQVRNKKYKTLIKNQLKKIASCLKGGEKNEPELKKLFREAQKVLDQAHQKKIIPQNRAADKKS